MGDFFTQIQDILLNRNKIEEPDVKDAKPLDLNTKNRPILTQVTNVDLVQGRLKQELEDRRVNSRAISQLFVFEPEKTAWDRFKNMFIVNSYGFRSFEFRIACIMGGTGVLAGFFLRSKSAIDASMARFRKQHHLSLFLSNRDYASRISTFIGLNYIVDGIPKGFKIGSLCFFSTITTAGLCCVLDKANYSHFVIGYGTAGFLYRFQRGPKAAFAAAVIGSAFGLLFPLILWPYLYFSGKTLDGVYKESRQQYYSDKLKQQKFDREVGEAIITYNCGYFAAKKMVKEWREEEKTRIATMHALNVDAALSGLKDANN